jgi:nucleoside-diphosphate-sugar epimerase
MKSVLITGANGFIGRFIIQSAIEKGWKPYAGVRNGATLDTIKDLECEVVYLNYNSVEQLTQVIDQYRFDYIIHNAGLTRSPSLAELIKVNKSYLQHIVEAMRASRHVVSKLLYVSSLAAYGPADQQEEGIVRATSAPHPVTHYGYSKLEAEKYLNQQRDIPYIIVRPTAVYGPGEKDLLTVFQMIQKHIDLVAGFIPQKLTFVYASDLATLMCDIVASPHVHKAYFASDGQVYLGSQFSQLIKKSLGKRVIKIKLPIPLIRTIAFLSEKIGTITNNYPVLNIDKVNEIKARNWSVDISETVADIGYTPSIDLSKGVPITAQWYKDNKWL